MLICYVYKWTHIPTLKWYVGSRTKKGCHPDDGYICSSKYVKPLIQSMPNEWQRTIIATGTLEEMKELEREILTATDAMNDPRSFNLSNGCGAMRSQVAWNKGSKGLQTSWNKGLSGKQSHRYGKKLDYKKSWTKSPQAEQMLSSLSEQNKKRNSIQAECPHCKKTGQMVAMKRWHFDNCSSL
jgi:hypothetical protein